MAIFFMQHWGLVAYSRPRGITSAAEAIIQEPLDLVSFGVNVLCHHIVNKLISMRLKKHSFTCRTVTLFAEIR